MKKNNKRASASYVRKFLPSLRRVSTDEGRKWTVDGEKHFDTLQDVINAYGKRAPEMAEMANKAVKQEDENVESTS